MSDKFIKQPNGNYSCLSSVVDNFTNFNLTHSEAIDFILSERAFSRADAEQMLAEADISGRAGWIDALSTVCFYHGVERVEESCKWGYWKV